MNGEPARARCPQSSPGLAITTPQPYDDVVRQVSCSIRNYLADDLTKSLAVLGTPPTGLVTHEQVTILSNVLIRLRF